MASPPTVELVPPAIGQPQSCPSSPTQRTAALRSALKPPASNHDDSLQLHLEPSISRLSLAEPSKYRRGVAFDTWTAAEESRTGGGTGIDFSYTLQAKSEGYVRTRKTREFLCATDSNEYSLNALDWLTNNLVNDGDEIVILTVLEPPKEGQHLSKQAEEAAKEEAKESLDTLMAKVGQRQSVSLIIELCVGKIQETIQRMISIYKPDSLVVGTRGRTDHIWKTPFMGSISRYCLLSSPVPVIVVRPERKVRKSLEQRRARSSYSNIVNPSPKGTIRPDDATDSGASGASTPVPNADKRSPGLMDPMASLRFLTPSLPWTKSKGLKRFQTAPG